jgi:hypothetical protein
VARGSEERVQGTLATSRPMSARPSVVVTSFAQTARTVIGVLLHLIHTHHLVRRLFGEVWRVPRVG